MPTVVASLACCTIQQIDTHLVPAIAKLRNEKDLSRIVSETMRDEIRTAVAAAEAPELQEEMMMGVLLGVFSFDKGCRQKSHIQISRMPPGLRRKYLDVFDRLVDSQSAHLRGEAFYCLGQIQRHNRRPSIQCRFL